MNVLVIGNGGREHALAWKIAQSSFVNTVYLAPGNGGTALEEKCKNVPAVNTCQAALSFAKDKAIDLTVVGPEAYLAQGIVDLFRNAGLRIVGPGLAESKMESSKSYAKVFMQKFGVRTASSMSFCDYEAALSYLQNYMKLHSKVVIKADGLAAGKGVFIADDFSGAQHSLFSLMRAGEAGEAGDTVVIEEYLCGKEVSVLASVSVSPGGDCTIVPFIAARDHKRRFDGGLGPNTGGMGAIAPVEDFTQEAQDDFLHAILQPTVRGMKEEGMDYRGFIFFGLMIENNSCYLLEYNVRLGDPETQAVLPLLESDMVLLCSAILDGSLSTFPLKWRGGSVCTVVASACGYPLSYRRGDIITVDKAKLDGGKLFMAGVEEREGNLYTSGGRVCAISAWGADAKEAREKAYTSLSALNFAQMQYRSDIGL